MNLQQLVTEAAEAADNPEHEWDRRAIDWPHLTPESVVFEVGSFKGRWALQIARRYNPRLFCFEPQAWACDVTAAALEGYNAQVFCYGLGVRNETRQLGEFGTDGCSVLAATRETASGVLRDIAEVVQELDTPHIDLMLINIEGYEFVLLPYMLDCGIMPDLLMVQIHEVNGYKGERLGETLSEKYRLLWDYGLTLSAWKKKTP